MKPANNDPPMPTPADPVNPADRAKLLRVTPPRQTPLVAPATAPAVQLGDLPKDELAALAEEYGLDPTRHPTRQHLVTALHARRQLIAQMDRDAMLDAIRWGRRPVAANASKEQLALEIARIKSMRFSGLSRRGLIVLAQLRGARVDGTEETPVVVKRLKARESLGEKFGRKRRAAIGAIVHGLVGGGTEDEGDYQFLPPAADRRAADRRTSANAPASESPPSHPPPPRRPSLKQQIEESGLFGGLANRAKQTADSYLNQKLDEIEARIDRKLDEIDRRLAEWRDKEIANRIRILKITLWASVIVAALSLVYAYLKVYVPGLFGG